MDSEPDSLAIRHQTTLELLNSTHKFTDEWFRLKSEEISFRRELASVGIIHDGPSEHENEEEFSMDLDKRYLQSDELSGRDNHISKSQTSFSVSDEGNHSTRSATYNLDYPTGPHIGEREPPVQNVQRSFELESASMTQSHLEADRAPGPFSMTSFAEREIYSTDSSAPCDLSLPQENPPVPIIQSSIENPKLTLTPSILDADRAPVPVSMTRFTDCEKENPRSSFLPRGKDRDAHVMINENYHDDRQERIIAEAHHAHTSMGSNNGLDMSAPNLCGGDGLVIAPPNTLLQSAPNDFDRSIYESPSQPHIEPSYRDEDDVINVPVAFRVEEDVGMQIAVEVHPTRGMTSVLKHLVCVFIVIMTIVVIALGIALPVILKTGNQGTNTDELVANKDVPTYEQSSPWYTISQYNPKNDGNPKKCIEIRRAYINNGNSVWLHPCNDTPAQYWMYTSTDSKNRIIQSYINLSKCIVGESFSTNIGTRLIINDCISDDNRFAWDTYSDGSIRPRNNNEACVVASDEGELIEWGDFKTQGFYLVLLECDSTDSNVISFAFEPAATPLARGMLRSWSGSSKDLPLNMNP